MITKQKISSEAQWKSLVYDYLTNGNRGKSNFYELLRTNYKCEKSNTLKQYDIYEAEYDLTLNKGKDDIILDSEKERLKKAILTKDKALELLTKTAQGKARQVGSEVVIPSHSDSINAIKTMAELLGWKTPQQINLKGNLEHSKTIETKEQAKEYLKKLDEI